LNNKVVLSAVFTVLACIGVALSQQAPTEGDTGRSDCRGEASYTTTSLGIAFEVSFDFAVRDDGGEDLGFVIARTAPTPGVGFVPGFNAAARIHSVEFHGDIAIFVTVWQRGTSGALGQFFGIASDPAGTASVIGIRDGAAGGFTDLVSEQFFFLPDQVPADPNDLLNTPAIDDFGQPIVGHEEETVREFILTQLSGNAPTRPPFTIHPGGDVQISGGR